MSFKPEVIAERLEALMRDVQAYDDVLNDKDNDGLNARPPNGDDYNELFEIIAEHVLKARIEGDA